MVKTQITISGVVEDAGEVKMFGKMQKRVVVVRLNDNSEHTSYFPITFKGPKLGLANGLRAGDCVTVSGYVNSFRWQKRGVNGNPEGPAKYFLEISATSLSRDGQGGMASSDAGDYPG